MNEANESITDISLNSRDARTDEVDDIISNVPVTTGMLVTNQTEEALEGESIDIQQPIQILNAHYMLTRLKDENIGTSGNNSLLTFSNTLDSNVPPCGHYPISTEPLSKRKKLSIENSIRGETLKKSLMSVQHDILQRLENIEKKVENVSSRCQFLEEKVENIVCQIKETGYNNRLALSSSKGRSGTIIIGMPPANHTASPTRDTSSPASSSAQLITLNSLADYPDGSWLGDPDNPDMRVRCHLVESDLENINKTCTSPEKLALTLLDYLFDRETQACSNISGTGRHGKKQLDPLKIYGIRCHLMYRFNIAEKDWHRIKQNLDSKCRTAFRRKQKGMPLAVKAFRDRMPTSCIQMLQENDPCSPSSSPSSILQDSNSPDLQSISANESGLGLDQSIELTNAIPLAAQNSESDFVSMPLQHIIGEPQVIHTEHGDIQVVHATPEQLVQMQQNHQIQILAGAEVLKELQVPSCNDQS